MELPTQSNYGSRILQVFERNLASWRRPSFCGRHFYHVKVFEEWMAREEQGEGCTNTEFLLLALQEKLGPHHNQIFHLKDNAVLAGHVRVFGVLLEMKRGELIPLFRRADVTDSILDVPNWDNGYLRDELVTKEIPDVDTVLDEFEKLRWGFCPVQLTLNMGKALVQSHILPFCKGKVRVINNKGGQASVVQVAVEKAFVQEELRKVLRNAKYIDKEFGECFMIAKKIFRGERKRVGEEEQEALLAFSDSESDWNNKHIIRYLGHFQHKQVVKDKLEDTYNILLEFGKLDLDEYFAETEPPTGRNEILSFWKSLFKVAEALATVHRFSLQRWRYSGVHGDVKPDNILVVDGHFKLCDFGFARFNRHRENSPEKPKYQLDGGTRTYCPPEGLQGKEVTEKFDIWSFGTVLLIAATWVVLGNKGLAQFEFLRKVAIAELKQDENGRSQLSNTNVSDIFHDGKSILPEIQDWCNVLKERKRQCDPITDLVLELVEDKLLRDTPRDRISSQDLCKKLNQIVFLATASVVPEAEFDKSEKYPNVLKALVAYEQGVAANLNEIEVKSLTKNNDPKKENGGQALVVPLVRSIRNSERVDKSQKLNKTPRAKTAGLKEVLEKQIQEDGYDVPEFDTPPLGQAVEPEANVLVDLAKNPSHAPTTNHIKRENFLVETQALEGPSTAGNELARPNIPAVLIGSFPKSSKLDASSRSTTRSGSHVASGVGLPAILKERKMPFPDIPEAEPSKAPEVQLSENEKPKRSVTQAATPISKLQPVRDKISDLDYPIVLYRMDYEKIKPKGVIKKAMARVTGGTTDAHLKRFISDRDLVFIVDNGSSMRQYRFLATFLVETLAHKLQGIDKDGLDLKFTIGQDYNVKEAKSDAPKLFKNAMFKAWRDDDAYRTEKTDMCQTLSALFADYMSGRKKQTTLLIVTDGIWDEPPPRNEQGELMPCRLEKKLVQFISKLTKLKKLEDRWFTIQFIQLGEDREASARFRRFDDDLETVYKDLEFPDVIDHEHWTGPIDKMIQGSMLNGEDIKVGSLVPDDPMQAPPPNIDDLFLEFYNQKTKNTRTLSGSWMSTRNSFPSPSSSLSP